MLAPGLVLSAKAWQIDEPFFLALARRILSHPGDPLGFAFNWYGVAMPMAELNNTPPLFPYLLAAVLRLGGGGEFATRALLLPFDLAAAWAFLTLAARALKKPLFPVLAVLLGPAWIINMNHAMPERVVLGLALPAILLFVRAVEDGARRAFWLSAALCALALTAKLNAAFAPAALLAWGWARGVPLPRLAAWGAFAASGLAMSSAWSAWAGGGAGGAVGAVLGAASGHPWASAWHRLRAFLSFPGGLAPWAALAALALRPGRPAWAAAAAAALAFQPALDLAPVRPADRLLGAGMAAATVLLAVALARGASRRSPWPWWLGAAALLQAAYWSVLARMTSYLLPPLALWAAEALEERAPRAAPRVWAAGAFLSAALGLACAAADWAHAESYRTLAREAVAPAVRAGRAVWYTGHWGLQEYAEAAGARPRDAARGGWEEARRGDLVVAPRSNSNALLPVRPLAAARSVRDFGFPVPVRLVGGWGASAHDAAFYSSAFGFLPWSLAADPVETLTLVEPL